MCSAHLWTHLCVHVPSLWTTDSLSMYSTWFVYSFYGMDSFLLTTDENESFGSQIKDQSNLSSSRIVCPEGERSFLRSAKSVFIWEDVCVYTWCHTQWQYVSKYEWSYMSCLSVPRNWSLGYLVTLRSRRYINLMPADPNDLLSCFCPFHVSLSSCSYLFLPGRRIVALFCQLPSACWVFDAMCEPAVGTRLLMTRASALNNLVWSSIYISGDYISEVVFIMRDFNDKNVVYCFLDVLNCVQMRWDEDVQHVHILPDTVFSTVCCVSAGSLRY